MAFSSSRKEALSVGIKRNFRLPRNHVSIHSKTSAASSCRLAGAGGVQLSPKELPDRCGWPENLRRFADGRAAPLDAGDDEQIGEEEQGSFLPGAQRRRNGDQVVAVEGAFRRGQVARS